jgi:hypothetical protein
MAAGVACFTDRVKSGQVDPTAPLADSFGDFPEEFLRIRAGLVEALEEDPTETEDYDTTVDRVARALCHVDGHLWPGDEADLVPEASSSWTVTGKPWRYRVEARAAVRALREGA